MDLSAWRERRLGGEEFTLPSGLVMRLRRVSLLDLAAGGQIPAPLVRLTAKSRLLTSRLSASVVVCGSLERKVNWSDSSIHSLPCRRTDPWADISPL